MFVYYRPPLDRRYQCVYRCSKDGLSSGLRARGLFLDSTRSHDRSRLFSVLHPNGISDIRIVRRVYSGLKRMNLQTHIILP